MALGATTLRFAQQGGEFAPRVLDRRQDGTRLRIVPGSIIDSVRVDPCEDELSFLPREEIAVQFVVEEYVGEGRLSGAMLVGLEEFARIVRGAVHAAHPAMRSI